MLRSNVSGLGGIISIQAFYQFIHYINTMVIHNSYPSPMLPCLVQVNYSDGDIAFHLAENFQDGLDNYMGNLVAIFKCKPKP